MRRPWFKFFPTDWQADSNLRMCSLEARGLWIEMICIMHNSPRRGYLESPSGTPLNDDMLCRLIGTNKDDLYRCKNELIELGVLSIDDLNGAIYCRRMVKEDSKSKKCADAARRGGGNPALLNKENIHIPEARSHISLKATFKGADPAAAAMVEDILNCRPEFAHLPPEPFFLAIHNAGSNPRLAENHAEFLADMANTLSLPKVPAKLYAKYLQSAGNPAERAEQASGEPAISPRKRPQID